MFQVFQPLKVRDSDTTSVTEHVWKEADSFFEEDFLSFSGGGSIGSFNDQFALEPFCVIEIDGLLKGCWDEDIAELTHFYHSL